MRLDFDGKYEDWLHDSGNASKVAAGLRGLADELERNALKQEP